MVVLNDVQWSADQIAAFESLATRVANSSHLQGSPKLREFFQYVIDCALRQVPEEATEQQIGVHVFHRRPGYNSGDDSIVRTQARLLRAKISAYFSQEGNQEPLVIEIPKGQYFPVFHAADETVEQNKASLGDVASASSKTAHEMNAERPYISDADASAKTRRNWVRAIILCVAGSLVLGGGVGYVWKGYRDHPATPVLDAFWKPFYASNKAVVIYSNPTFVGDPNTGLRLVPMDVDGARKEAGTATFTDETYTGTGEAEAIHTLTSLFDAHGSIFTLKRSKLVTWDEARSSSLIFVGAPSQNTALNDLQTLSQFSIAMTPDHRGYIVNAHPHANEPATYPRQSATQETAIVALLPGLRPDTRIAIFCGLSTVGTQEAVEFLTQQENLRTLINTVGTENHLLKPFEAVLRINTSAGVAMNASFVAIHKH
jgi:hypothetical protein